MGEDVKGARRMPWHRKSTKDAASCDKLRGGANGHYDPEVSEWGNPAGTMARYRASEHIGCAGTTRGTETSKYPEEEKSTEIARVAASESAPAQTHARVSGEALPHGRCGIAPTAGSHPAGAVTKDRAAEPAWKGRPKRVTAP